MSDISNKIDCRLEAVRLAPSAVNNQPWYFYCSDDGIYVYCKKLGTLKKAMYETMNQIDMGIALCHLWLASEKEGYPFEFIPVQQGVQEVADYTCIGKVQ